MEILAGIVGVTSLLLVCAISLIVFGQQLGTSSKLVSSKQAWKRKFANFAFKFVMPAGIVISVVLLPLLILLGVATFVAFLLVL